MRHGLFTLLMVAMILSAAADSGSASSANDPFAQLATYVYPGDRSALTAATTAVAQASSDPIQLRRVEKQLLNLLKQPNLSREARQFICDQLIIASSDQSVPALSAMLADETTADMARFTLEQLNSPAADQTLREALTQLRGRALLGLIGSVGQRRDAAAATTLEKLAAHEDTTIAQAAVRALGMIGSPQALAVLSKLADQRDPAIVEARLRCADALLALGSARRAVKQYAMIYRDQQAPSYIRQAALHGLISADPVKAQPSLAASLDSPDAKLQLAAIDLTRQLSPELALVMLTPRLSALGADHQIAAISALASFDNPKIADRLIQLLTHDDPAVRLAAMTGLQRQTHARGAIVALAEIAATASGDLQGAARLTLSQLPGDHVNQEILATLTTAPAAIQQELIRAVGQRKINSVLPMIVGFLDDEHVTNRIAALEAIELIGGETLWPKLIDIMARTDNRRERQAAGKALLKVARQQADAKTIVTALKQVVPRAHTDGRTAILNTLSGIGGAVALQAVIDLMDRGDEAIKDQAVRTLSRWSDATAAPPLLAIAQTTDSDRRCTLALRGVARLAPSANEVALDQRIAWLTQALETCRNDQDRQLLTAALEQIAASASPQTDPRE